MPRTTRKPRPARRPVLAYKTRSGGQVTVFLLNPGEHFPQFGGSSAGLTVYTKTASLIVRRVEHGVRRDTEHDVADRNAWAEIQTELTRDSVAMDAIHQLMTGNRWDGEMTTDIDAILRETGRETMSPDEMDDTDDAEATGE